MIRRLFEKIGLVKHKPTLSVADDRKAECPYCHEALAKIPGAKTKCPHCSQYMFVRTRPNGVRSVVTKEIAGQIEKDWLDEMQAREWLKTKEWQVKAKEIAVHNLQQWKTCGVVNTLKIYVAPLDNVCEFCKEMEGEIIDIADAEMGITIPPFECCRNANTLGCRCRFIPCDMKSVISE